jgi:dihydroorotate dehydrogenase electron transfer subunit
MIETSRTFDPLLRRPFSYMRSDGPRLGFLYRVKGKGTLLMKDFLPGQEIDILGPLGRSFPRPPAGSTPLVIAGGTGVASLFPLLSEFSGKSFMVYGARTGEELLLTSEVEKTGSEVLLCTQDCSRGEEGLVTDILVRFLDSAEAKLHSFYIYACGPAPMLAAVAKIAEWRKIPGCASLEEKMGCGFGACQGCVVRTVQGYLRVCVEGPVFRLEDIVWEVFS